MLGTSGLGVDRNYCLPRNRPTCGPAVPRYFWKRGTKQGAIAGMVAGFIVVLLLEYHSPNSLPWACGLTSGVIALAINAVIYVGAAYLLPMPHEERRRVDALFARIASHP